MIIDDTTVYHFGAFLKDAGRRVFRLSKMKDEPERKALIERFGSAWAAAKLVSTPHEWRRYPKCYQHSGILLPITGADPAGDYYECDACGHVWMVPKRPTPRS